MVIKIKYGNTNTYLIKGDSGNLLIDTDYAGTKLDFYKAIKEVNVKICDITYVIATHYHPDHMGLISELMQQGVKLLIIDKQLNYVHFSDKIFSRDKRLNYKSINECDALIVTCPEAEKILYSIGVSANIVPTCSHSEDGIALILNSGECFVGDLEPKEHLEAYNNEDLKNDWENIVQYKPKIIYFGHINKKEFKEGNYEINNS